MYYYLNHEASSWSEILTNVLKLDKTKFTQWHRRGELPYNLEHNLTRWFRTWTLTTKTMPLEPPLPSQNLFLHCCIRGTQTAVSITHSHTTMVQFNWPVHVNSGSNNSFWIDLLLYCSGGRGGGFQVENKKQNKTTTKNLANNRIIYSLHGHSQSSLCWRVANKLNVNSNHKHMISKVALESCGWVGELVQHIQIITRHLRNWERERGVPLDLK